MEQINRLGWAAGMTAVSYGVRLGFRVTDPGILAEIQSRLPPGARRETAIKVPMLYSVVSGGPAPRPGVRRFHLLYANAARLVRALDAAEVFTTLERHAKLHVAETAPKRLFVHAGVVAWRGRAIVVPGRSFSGKSNLVAALLKAGARYYSDEYAVFDGTGRVHAFPTPLSLRDPVTGNATRHSVDCPGGIARLRPLPVGLIVSTLYRANARWRPRELSGANAILELLAHAVPARSRPNFTLSILRRSVKGARALKGIRGEASELALPLLTAVAEAELLD